jgi:hypothetical protein
MGATHYDELYPEKIASSGKINFAHVPGKNARYYIENFAGGFDSNADRKRVTVEHRNGKIEKTKSFLFFRSYPSVAEGSIIKVPTKKVKPIDPERQKKDGEDVNWSNVLKDSITQATSVLTLILLLRSIN